MFYGKGSANESPGSGRGNRNERFDQMVRQQQLIEQKKLEIQKRLEADKQKRAKLEAGNTSGSQSPSSTTPVAGASSSSSITAAASQRSKEDDDDDDKGEIQNVFNNDGSFFEQFKKMQEEAMKKKKEEEEKEKASASKIKEENVEYDDYGNPIKPSTKPVIKLLNPQAFVKSEESRSKSSKVTATDIISKSSSQNYYNVPPPPPPPPIKHESFKSSNANTKFQAVPPPPPPPQTPPPPKVFAGFPSPQVKALASIVAEQGDHIEEELRMKHHGDPLMWFLFKPDSAEYRTFRGLVMEMKSNSRNYMYNQAPPPPPVMKQSFKADTKMHGHQKIREPIATSSNFVKLEQPNFIKHEPQNFIKQEIQTFVKQEPQDFAKQSEQPTFVKQEPQNCESQGTILIGVKREAPEPEEETEQERKERKRRSRWGPQATDVPPVAVVVPPLIGSSLGTIPSTALAIMGASNPGINLMSMPLMALPSGGTVATLSKVTRANPQLVAYAQQAYGRVDLDEDEWKQCEEAYKMNLVFQDIARKKAQDEERERAGKFKHEYDSDEETEGGTWEHKQRIKEMEKTKDWAVELTEKAKGKHHIGDFLPPEQLAKFMEKYKAVKEGKRLDDSEYQEYKIQQDNIGFKMLQKMGWSSGEGLGAEKQGIVAPIDKGHAPSDKQGLGVEQPGDLNEEDDEYAAYRKRMMLAYRFRPNPLNNPRRAYY